MEGAYLVSEHEVAGPGRGDGGGVLAGEEGRDEHAGDLLVRGSPAAVGAAVLAVHEVLEEVMLTPPSRPSCLDHLAEDACQLLPCPVY